jgi:release factor glutamine methyltransferase
LHKYPSSNHHFILKFKTNKIKDIGEYYLNELKKKFPQQEAAALLDMVFTEYMSLSRIDRQLNPEQRLTESEMLKVHFAVKELMKDKPIQYILRRAEFYGLGFYVDERVLIPRPETEELVEWVIGDNQRYNKKLNILDLGTGSGCIAVALKKNMPRAELWATDISPEALDVARKNAEANAVSIRFIRQEFSAGVVAEAPPMDIIVSNPPYVQRSEKDKMSANVLNYEPSQALFVDDSNPLIHYGDIAALAREALLSGGTLYLEINQYLGKETAALLSKSGFTDIVLRKDLNGNDRMIRAQKL